MDAADDHHAATAWLLDPEFDGGAGSDVARWLAAMDAAGCVRTRTAFDVFGPRSLTSAVIADRGETLRIDQQLRVTDLQAAHDDQELRAMVRRDGETWVAVAETGTHPDDLVWTHVVDHEVDEDSLPEEPDAADEEAWAAWDALVTEAYSHGPGIFGLIALELPDAADPWRMITELRAFPAFAPSAQPDGTTVWTARIDGLRPPVRLPLGSLGRDVVRRARVVTDPAGRPVEIDVRLATADDPATANSVHMMLSDWGRPVPIQPPPPGQVVEHDEESRGLRGDR